MWKTSLIVCAALLTTAAPALAFDPTGNAVVDGFVAGHGGDDIDATVSGIEQDGDTVTIGSARFAYPDGETLTYSDITIEAGRMEDGVLLADRSVSGGFSLTVDDPTLGMAFEYTAQNATCETMRMPEGSMAMDGSASDFVYCATNTWEAMSMSFNGQPMELGGGVITMSDWDGEGLLRSTLSMDGGSVDLAAIAPGVALPRSGRTALDFSVDGTLTWDPAGVLEVETLDVAVADLGNLGLSFAIEGLTDDVLAALNAYQPNPNDPQSAQLPPEVGALVLNDFAVSVAGEALASEILGATLGTDLPAEAAGDMAVGLASGMLMAIPDEMLAQNAMLALSAFLKGGERLTVSVDPEPAVSVGELMSLASQGAQPAVMLERLGAAVRSGD